MGASISVFLGLAALALLSGIVIGRKMWATSEVVTSQPVQTGLVLTPMAPGDNLSIPLLDSRELASLRSDIQHRLMEAAGDCYKKDPRVVMAEIAAEYSVYLKFEFRA